MATKTTATKITRKVSKVDRLNAHMQNSRNHYVPGHTMTHVEFVKRYGTIFPNLVGANPTKTQDAVKFANAVTSINRLLRHKGLQLCSRNYYTKFEVLTSSKTTKKINHNRKKMKTIALAMDELETGLRNNPNQKVGKGVPKAIRSKVLPYFENSVIRVTY